MTLLRLILCTLATFPAILALPAHAQTPSPDDQFRIVNETCRAVSEARVAEENATGLAGPEPKGDSSLRWLVSHSDADVNLAMSETRQVENQLSANPGADALPIARVVHKQAAETYCFGENVLKVRREGASALAESSMQVGGNLAAGQGGGTTSSGNVDPSILEATAQADAAAAAALQTALATAQEPGPLGLRDMPAKVAERPRTPTSEKPMLVGGRHDGGFQDCLIMKMDEPVLNKENNWSTEFELTNNCGEQLLIQMDAAEFDEGDPNPVGYHKAQFPASWGIPNNAVWPDDYELPADLGFQPHMRRGEGAIHRNYPPKFYLVDARAPRRTIKYYIVACPLMNPDAQRQNVMFISGARLMDAGVTFKCVPHPLRRD